MEGPLGTSPVRPDLAHCALRLHVGEEQHEVRVGSQTGETAGPRRLREAEERLAVLAGTWGNVDSGQSAKAVAVVLQDHLNP